MAQPPLPTTRHTHHIRSEQQLTALTAGNPAPDLAGVYLEDLDLRHQLELLDCAQVRGSVFLRCTLPPDYTPQLRQRGALVFPQLPQLPFSAERTQLYTPEELYVGIDQHPYEQVPDAQVYAFTNLPAAHQQAATLAMALHDHSIGEALNTLCRSQEGRIVGVMGGHAAQRGSSDYARAAALGHSLAAAGFMVATGGGPGAMEAANAGAYFSELPETTVQQLLAGLSGSYEQRSHWVRSALALRQRHRPSSARSLGIPTWAYGHEPPNVFSQHIAKYFANSLREAVLVEKCDAGIVFLPGAAGTIQEIFQDACENYYAPEQKIAPMILMGRRYWSEELPAWPLLQALAAPSRMREHIFLVDEVAEVMQIIHARHREPHR